MNEFIYFLLIIFGLVFLGQVIKGISNILSIFGRIGGWILGIILFFIVVKFLIFG